MKRIFFTLIAGASILAAQSWAVPITINMTADNAIISGGLCETADCMDGEGWASLNGASPLPNGDDWREADSVTVDLDAGTHWFAWNLQNSGTAGPNNPAGLLADIIWAGGSNVSSSAWEIYDFATGAFISSATEYGLNDPSDSNIWNDNGGPVAGISSAAAWLYGPDNGTAEMASDLWIRTSIKVPEPGTLALLGAGLIGLGFARRARRGS